MKKIAVTGSKGKTTIVRLLDHLLVSLGEKTLSMDSDFIKLNSKKIGNQDLSLKLSQMIISKCPGRFLSYGFNHKTNNWNIDVAVMETVIGCWHTGLGYRDHDIGIFTNVFNEHISQKEIKSKNDIAYYKSSFIWKLSTNGFAIYNGDDKYILKHLAKYDSNIQNRIVVSEQSSMLNMLKYNYFTLIDDKKIIIYKQGDKVCALFDCEHYQRAFNGMSDSAVKNIAFVLSGLLAYYGEKLFEKNLKKIDKILRNYEVDYEGGRMIYIENNGKKIILDYAHELNSFKSILNLAKRIAGKSGHVWGVIRMAPDRLDTIVQKTGKTISKLADHFVIYDKIDGITKQEYLRKKNNILRKKGDIMNILADSIKNANANADIFRIPFRKDAMKFALKSSNIGDVILVIVNDPVETWTYLKRILHIKNTKGK